MKEILFIDKPKGITSFDVIRILRKKLGIRKIGHGGSLDPQATGLLIVGIDKGTKKLKDFFHLPKTYLMEILLGQKTDTGDLEGKIIEEKKVKKLNLQKLKEILKSMQQKMEPQGQSRGPLDAGIELPIPLYSAIKIKGKPLYRYAREGIKINPPKRKMKIFSLKLLDIWQEEDFYILKIEMRCGGGTYARSVACEIGRRLSLPATLKELRRTEIGNINISQAKKLTH